MCVSPPQGCFASAAGGFGFDLAPLRGLSPAGTRLAPEVKAEPRAVPAPALLVVSHDLAAVARVCQRALVMDEGSIVEDAPMRRLLTKPTHTATRALRDAVPTLPTTTD